jgi:DNA-directed RNA polymerase subunit L
LIVALGFVLSIQVTVVIVSQVFPARSSNSKVKDQFQVKVYKLDHQLLVMLTHDLLNHVNVTVTSCVVNHVVLYSICAVGIVYKSYHSIANQYTLFAE